MHRKLLLILIFIGFFTIDGFAERRRQRSYRRPASQTVHTGRWIGSLGTGLMIDPTFFMVTLSLEYEQTSRLLFGPLIQMGFGSILFTGSGMARYRFTRRGQIQPFVDGGLGVAAASSSVGGTLGLHLFGGLGADYFLTDTITLGSVVRANFAFGIKDFFLSWPIVILRMRV